MKPRVNLDAVLAAWPSSASRQGEAQAEAAVASIRARLDDGGAIDAGARALSALSDDELFREPFPEVGSEIAQSSSGSVRGAGSAGIQSPTSVPPTGEPTHKAMSSRDSTRAGSEGSSMTQQAERRRDRTSFQELAKMAQTPPPPSLSEQVSSKSGPLSTPAASNQLVWPSTPNLAGPPSTSGPWAGAESDSGMVDLKSISNADPTTAAAHERAKATALASEGLFEDPPAAASSAPPSLASGDRSTMPSVGGQPTSHAAVASQAPSAAISAAPAVSAVSSVAQATGTQNKKKGGAGVVIGLVAAFGAIAAGAFFFVSQKATPAPVAMTAPAEVKQPVAPAAPPVVAAPAPAVEEAPIAHPEPATGKPGRKHAKAGGGGAKLAAADSPKSAAPEPVAAKEAKPVGPFTGGSLKDEMEKRSGGEKGAAPEVADDSKNAARGTQPKPSQGQVTGAIGAVLMKARECLGPDDPVSKANVVFASSGAVQSVSVSGGAAGKPAEACVKAALGKAKVPAFADATYSFPVTVRPL